MMRRSWLLKALVLCLLVGLLAGSGSAAAEPPAPDALPRGVCPTGTTLIPVPLTLRVTLQRPNSPPPSAAWGVPVTFVLYPPGDPVTICHQWDVTLDPNGLGFGYPLLFMGTYDVRIRNLHTLRNVKRNVVISPWATIDMGTLYEGDCNGDNIVNILDFGILRMCYFLDEGMPGFCPRCDLDENNTINIFDFALLRSNYFKEGDIEVAALASAAVAPVAVPVTVTLIPLTRDFCRWPLSPGRKLS